MLLQVNVDGIVSGPEDEFDDYLEGYEEGEMGAEGDEAEVPGLRAHKSLVLLTQRFISFLHNTPAGLVDLNMVLLFLLIFQYYLNVFDNHLVTGGR